MDGDELKYTESGTGTIHLHPGDRYRSFCGQNRSRPRRITNDYRAWAVVDNDCSDGGINADLCKRCLRTADRNHRDALMTLYEMADEFTHHLASLE